MRRSGSLVERISWGAAAAAAFSALLAAIVTSALSSLLLQQAEDRRLNDAAMILAYELGEGATDLARVEAVIADELAETDHTGLVFAVLDHGGTFFAGERRIVSWRQSGCMTAAHGGLRVCGRPSSNGLTAIAASAHAMPTSLFAWSAGIGALLAGAIASLLSRPVSRMAIAPLARFRAQLTELDVDARAAANFGPREQIQEVDELRHTIEQLLERVDQSIEQSRRFAANAAHELRTPLTTVRAELELLLGDNPGQGALPAGASQQVARVEQHVAALALLVERLLVLTMPKSRANDAAELVSMRDIIEDAVATLTDSEKKRVQTSERDALVRGDAVLLQTMVSNALSNALKFGTNVRVDIERSKREAIVLIDDDGNGVPEEDRERVFEPFYRAHGALSARIPGHGLGLALIRHIAEAHGGHASFTSQERPAQLAIRLPMVPDNSPSANYPHTHANTL